MNDNGLSIHYVIVCLFAYHLFNDVVSVFSVYRKLFSVVGLSHTDSIILLKIMLIVIFRTRKIRLYAVCQTL